MGKWLAGILATVIAGLIVWHLTDGLRNQGRGSENDSTSSHGSIVDAQPTKLTIKSAAVPHVLRPNTEYNISILVLSEKSLPVENAIVEINVGGGSFLDTGNFTTIGNTDARGAFKTKWKSLASIPNGYQFGVKARKNGLNVNGELWIRR